MTPIALKALKGSIRKWEKIVAGVGEDHGDRNCPLCKLYLDKRCRGCPVFKFTGKMYCDGTPYQDQWVTVMRYGADKDDVMTDAEILAAISELRFLRSLLPASAANQ